MKEKKKMSKDIKFGWFEKDDDDEFINEEDEMYDVNRYDDNRKPKKDEFEDDYWSWRMVQR